MSFIWSLFALLQLDVVTAKSSHAVLVAGSREYYNYRHQADVCHAYHIMRQYGVPAENIIVMMYDDVAHDKLNPFPGKLFNQFSEGTGRDVYEGCKIDYRGETVTPERFLNILKGLSTDQNTEKVLQSTEEDEVFIYYTDHGGDHVVAFPAGEEPYLYAHDLAEALSQMKYDKLVFYLEACESGSMFKDYIPPRSLLVTASNSTESSYATYCGKSASVNGTNLNTCLGDEFSVRWMEDLEVKGNIENFQDQVKRLITRVKESHVQFFESSDAPDGIMIHKFFDEKYVPSIGNLSNTAVELTGKHSPNFSSRRHSLDTLLHKMTQMIDSDEDVVAVQEEIKEQEKKREFTDLLFAKFNDSFCGSDQCKDLAQEDFARTRDCYKALVSQVHSKCLTRIGTEDMYFMSYFGILRSACAAKRINEVSTDQMATKIDSICAEDEALIF